jgi:hypothetical protein
VLGELKKYGIINPANEALVNTVLERVTGTPVAHLKDVVVPVERIRGGAFKIGNTTFEELFTIFLGQALQGGNPGAPQAPAIIKLPADPSQVPAPASAPAALPKDESSENQPHVPQLPPADKPKSQPIELRDLSVRG